MKKRYVRLFETRQTESGVIYIDTKRAKLLFEISAAFAGSIRAVATVRSYDLAVDLCEAVMKSLKVKEVWLR